MRDVDPALFPNVVSALRQAGIDPERELVPVAPAAHYMMGGIATDIHGRATLDGLYAVGECSCTGLHGANRLASNSLTECFVFGARAARAALSEPPPDQDPARPTDAEQRSTKPPALSPESRQALWELAGLERDGDGLRALADDPHPLVRLIAECALARTESRGAHERRDFPELDHGLDNRHVTLAAGRGPELETWL
jgi:L-aspartate oxidase